MDANDYVGIIKAGRARLRTHAEDADAWGTVAYASYVLGDLDTASSAFNKAAQLAPAHVDKFAGTLENIQSIRKRWPKLKLQAPMWADSDAGLEQEVWRRKAALLLKARKYDEIERIARSLQASRATGIDGEWLLEKFASGLWRIDDGANEESRWAASNAQIAAWRRARPVSLLARVAGLASWTEGAWVARGEDYAHKITDKQFKIMEQRLTKGAPLVESLLSHLKKSPLVAVRLQSWGLLAGLPRSDYMSIVDSATATFPTYITCDYAATNFLLERWHGEPGDWERYAARRANALGGVQGDVLYARLTGARYNYFANIWKESKMSWPRAQRGYEALLQRRPKSLSIATDYFWLAYMHNEPLIAQRLMIHHLGNRAIRGKWRNTGGFGETRMEVLSIEP